MLDQSTDEIKCKICSTVFDGIDDFCDDSHECATMIKNLESP